MCGIVGIAGKTKSGLWKPDVDLFSQMLFADQLRGVDGTGIIYNTDKGILTKKSATDASSFMGSKDYLDIMDNVSKTGHFLIGHNRAATRGSHVWKNTHPFREGNIILIHNGTLFRHDNLDKDCEVDSHAICKHMALHGAEETLSKVDGAFALVWVDLANLTLNMARNKERPLTITETGGNWIFSSEAGLAYWMADRNKRIISSQVDVEPEHIYTFDLTDMKEYTKKKVVFCKYSCPVQKTFPHYAGDWHTEFDNGFDDVDETKKPSGGKNKSDARKYGEQVMCKPDPLPNKVVDSAIIYDEKRASNFVLCKVYNEPDTEIRIYAKYKLLVSYCNATLLQGNVVQTIFRGDKVVHFLENIHIHKERGNKLLTVIEVGKKEKGEEDKDMAQCDFCMSSTPKKELILHSGQHLCQECMDCFDGVGSWSSTKNKEVH